MIQLIAEEINTHLYNTFANNMTASEAIRDIEFQISGQGGHSSPEIEARYRFSISILRHELPSHCREQILDLESGLQLYFSSNRHKRYSGGLQQLRIRIVSRLSGLQDFLNE